MNNNLATRPHTVLIADDDVSIRVIVGETLERAGFDVVGVGNFAALWRHVEAGEGDVVITDVVMPDADGIDMLPQIKRQRPDLPIIVMSAQNTLATAVRANEQGAFEYLPKPFDIDELTRLVQRAVEKRPKIGRVDSTLGLGDGSNLVGRSQAMQDVYRTMARVMGTDLRVMIEGESGTGKELIARALHDMGPRKTHPFVAVNMAAIPKELIESELFGHMKGAFTGADQAREGRFGEARGGTLFLDEIGDMPIEAQTRLLRVLQEGEYRRVGGSKSEKVDVRIIAATHKNLPELIRAGLFREDLFYRLNVVPLVLPPLRDRLEDIADLVHHFLAAAEKDGLPHKRLSQDAYAALTRHTWPGNVRELENLLRRLCVLYPEDEITGDILKRELDNQSLGAGDGEASEGLSDAVARHLRRYFAAHPNALPPSGLYDRVLKEIERPLIELRLSAPRGNQLKSADLLGLNRNTLRKKIHDLGIQVRRTMK